MRFEARAIKATLARLAGRKSKTPEEPGLEPAVFVPSPLLLKEFRRARTLNRNIQRASSFNPRLHRRATEAAKRVRAIDKYEREQFASENA